MRTIYRFFFLISLFLIAGCTTSNNSVVPTTTKSKPAANVPTPSAGTAVVTGTVTSMADKPYPGEYVFLAPVTYNDKGDGAFFLDTRTSKGAQLDDNSAFVFTNVPPADYVVVVGEPGVTAAAVKESGSGKPKIWKIEASKVFDLGLLKVNLGQ